MVGIACTMTIQTTTTTPIFIPALMRTHGYTSFTTLYAPTDANIYFLAAKTIEFEIYGNKDLRTLWIGREAFLCAVFGRFRNI